MIALTLTEVAAITGGALGGPTAAAGADTVTSVAIDSRELVAGGLFVALPGEHVDGHDYLAAAAERGAFAALVARDLPDAPLPTIRVPDAASALADLAREVLDRLRAAGELVVVGVTGSVGKTTTKDLLSVLLRPLGDLVAPVASFNNEIGLPLTVLRADRDTRVLVLEMGADAPGNLTFLTSVAAPDVAVELIVGHAHLRGFGSIEGVATAKAELVQGLAPGGMAVLNADDARVLSMATLADRVLTFGRSEHADVRAVDVVTAADGHAELTLVAEQGQARVRLGLAGDHHVTNALAAAAVALHLGRPIQEVAATLATAEPLSPHRMHVVDRADGIRVIDDAYNANPTSMRAALAALAAMTASGRRAVAVIGEMLELGEDSEREHAEIGRWAASLGVDEVVAVGSQTRAVHAAVAQAGGSAHYVTDPAEARSVLATLLQEGDVVLVKASNGTGLFRLAEDLAAAAGAGAA